MTCEAKVVESSLLTIYPPFRGKRAGNTTSLEQGQNGVRASLEPEIWRTIQELEKTKATREFREIQTKVTEPIQRSTARIIAHTTAEMLVARRLAEPVKTGLTPD
jgi:hypothetical protein